MAIPGKFSEQLLVDEPERQQVLEDSFFAIEMDSDKDQVKDH